MNRNPLLVTRRAALLPIVQLALLFALQTALPQATPAQTGEEIVAKVLHARGGLEKIKAVQAERLTGTIYFGPELYGPFVAEFKRPLKMHNEVTIQNKTVVRTFNGKDAGWIINPFSGKESAQAMSADDMKQVVGEADFDGPLVDAKAKGIVIGMAGVSKVEDRDAYKVKVTHKDGQVSYYFFDTETFLLVKWTGVDSVNGQTVTRETVFHDYRDVNGLKFPFELISSSPDADVTQKISVEKIELNPSIDESRFGKPAAVSTDAPASAPPDRR